MLNIFRNAFAFLYVKASSKDNIKMLMSAFLLRFKASYRENCMATQFF